MKSLLFLSHRIPYPPDKGDKIRSYHVLKALAQNYRVHMGAFVDSPDDWRHHETLRGLTSSMKLRPLSSRLATLRSVRGFMTGEPLSLPYYRDAAMQQWVDSTLEQNDIAAAYVFSSQMGQYLADRKVPVSVIDFCDVDSDKWAQYAKSKSWPLSWVYHREAVTLAETERLLAGRFDWSLFVSDNESELFSTMVPEAASRVVTLRNGVDTEYFDPAIGFELPDPAAPLAVFTGAMDYWANVDAVCWFVKEVWPSVRNRHAAARFLIVGSKPTAAVLELAKCPGVEVTGTVPDVRPFLARAHVVVAPLRIARGLQNKVLEALAMARPVVATTAALGGLDMAQVPGVCATESAEQFATGVSQWLGDVTPARDNVAGRDFVIERYGWSAALQPLLDLLCMPPALRANGAIAGTAEHARHARIA